VEIAIWELSAFDEKVQDYTQLPERGREIRLYGQALRVGFFSTAAVETLGRQAGLSIPALRFSESSEGRVQVECFFGCFA
jgi:hypothetical protein